MGVVKWLLIPVLLAALAYVLLVANATPPKIVVDENGWYGEGKARKDDVSIKPFTVNVSDSVIEDLKKRLQQSRINHDTLEDSDNFEYGFNVKYLRQIREYWLKKFDWSKQQQLLNKFPQFTTEIEGLQVHFYHVKPDKNKYKKSLPLLIVHGWPGNVFEFYKLMPTLLNPNPERLGGDYAFELIVPSIPGYGFSSQPRKTGFNQLAAARVFHKLLKRLGHDKYYLQGGDWGSLITANIARIYPENVLGLHVNMVGVQPGSNFMATLYSVLGSFAPQYLFKNPYHHGYSLSKMFHTILVESGYMHLQATKPDTVGTALNDSPIGLAAYILEKFSTWTNPEWKSLPDGGLTKKFTLDELLTIVSIYWTQGNIVSSQRFYKECFRDELNQQLMKTYIAVPTFHAQFKNDAFDKDPEELVRYACNLTRQVTLQDGGHFAAFEEPRLLARSIFEFVDSIESTR